MKQKIRKGILTYSALLFPLTFFFMSPYVIIMSAAYGIVNGSALFFGFLLLFSIIGSRLFCGWLCPGGAIQEQAAHSNSKAWNGKWKNSSKYIIWFFWLAFVVFLWISNGPLAVNFFNMYSLDSHIFVIYMIVVTLIYVFALATGKRGMCHSLCWMAPFMIIGEKCADFLHIPRFRLKAETENCISCGRCSKKCPMSLDVAEMVKTSQMDSNECISCLECADICPKQVIKFGISAKVK